MKRTRQFSFPDPGDPMDLMSCGSFYFSAAVICSYWSDIEFEYTKHWETDWHVVGVGIIFFRRRFSRQQVPEAWRIFIDPPLGESGG